ncbi:MAG: NAD(P)H-dependent oxidoreductase [Lachnospiraceae bacterium]|nr:NAD(P)H-dependent oxidoreductase [Lachnospiraceae bacterium]
MAKNLIIYYSRKGQNYVNGSIKSLAKGNTEIVAEFIQNSVGGDLFEVETVNDYSDDYMTCTEEAKAELRNDARPELKKYLDDISQYDNIIVAGPCWWGTYPMAVFSQLDRLDFTGKKVFPVMTHEGSGQAESTTALKKHCKGATVGNGIAIHGADAARSESTVASWAKKELG